MVLKDIKVCQYSSTMSNFLSIATLRTPENRTCDKNLFLFVPMSVCDIPAKEELGMSTVDTESVGSPPSEDCNVSDDHVSATTLIAMV